MARKLLAFAKRYKILKKNLPCPLKVQDQNQKCTDMTVL